MKRFFAKVETLTDNRPTAASWPKKIFEWEEIPLNFRPFVKDWVDSGMELGQITYVPRIHKFLKKQPEYAIAWNGEEVLLLSEQGGAVSHTILNSKKVNVIEYSIQLLNVVVSVAFQEDNQLKRETFQYTRTMEAQLVPNLNIMLGNPSGHEVNVFLNENVFCSDLRDKSYLMFNYSKLAYRMGDSMQHYYWSRMEQKIHKKDKDFPEYFACIMEKGLVLIDSQFYGISAVYLPFSSIQSVEMTMEPKFYLLVKTILPFEYRIPVPTDSVSYARDFVEHFRECSLRAV